MQVLGSVRGLSSKGSCSAFQEGGDELQGSLSHLADLSRSGEGARLGGWAAGWGGVLPAWACSAQLSRAHRTPEAHTGRRAPEVVQDEGGLLILKCTQGCESQTNPRLEKSRRPCKVRT